MIPDDFEVKPYHKIMVKKGATVQSTNPKRRNWVCSRNFTVITKVYSRKSSTYVGWGGSGGYWCWAKKAECDIVEEKF